MAFVSDFLLFENFTIDHHELNTRSIEIDRKKLLAGSQDSLPIPPKGQLHNALIKLSFLHIEDDFVSDIF